MNEKLAKILKEDISKQMERMDESSLMRLYLYGESVLEDMDDRLEHPCCCKEKDSAEEKPAEKVEVKEAKKIPVTSIADADDAFDEDMVEIEKERESKPVKKAEAKKVKEVKVEDDFDDDELDEPRKFLYL